MKTCSYTSSIARPETVAVSVHRHGAVRPVCAYAQTAFRGSLWINSKATMSREAGRF